MMYSFPVLVPTATNGSSQAPSTTMPFSAGRPSMVAVRTTVEG